MSTKCVSVAVQKVAEEFLSELFCNKTCMTFPSNRCPICDKSYKNYRNLKGHMIKIHSEVFAVEGKLAETDDVVVNHTHQLLKLLLLKRALDYSIKTANGNTLSLLMKHMTLYFHLLGYKNYALACFEHVAQCQLFLSERMRELIKHECFVNNVGKKDSNMAMDLDLEHRNKFFKENFVLKSSKPSDSVLSRLSHSQDKLESVLANFHQQFHIHRFAPERHINSDSYKADVKKLHSTLRPRRMLTHQPGRTLHSTKLTQAAHDPLLLVDMFSLKQWFHSSLSTMCDQRFLQ